VNGTTVFVFGLPRQSWRRVDCCTVHDQLVRIERFLFDRLKLDRPKDKTTTTQQQ